ncbi:MAG: hypothetical protein ACLFUJ_12660 [Phycisphaerae bacterium]
MDATDRQLLARLEDGLEIVARPLEKLAEPMGLDLPALLRRLEQLAGPQGLIRQISGIFQASGFGYSQTLAAMQLAPDKLDAAGDIVACHPGVSHCYSRAGSWNLWFTLAVSDRSRLGCEGTIRTLARQTGAAAWMDLPTLRRYKLRVRFGSSSDAATAQPPQPGPIEITGTIARTVRALQLPMPIVAEPFARLAEIAHLPRQTLLQTARSLHESGHLRRYSAVLQHRRAGARANLLAAWQVAPDAADASGQAMAASPAVSHCYLRPARADWPWNLYTMIHGRSEQQCRQTVETLAETTGLDQPRMLWTRREYKKRRLLLLTDDEARWEAACRQG